MLRTQAPYPMLLAAPPLDAYIAGRVVGRDHFSHPTRSFPIPPHTGQCLASIIPSGITSTRIPTRRRKNQNVRRHHLSSRLPPPRQEGAGGVQSAVIIKPDLYVFEEVCIRGMGFVDHFSSVLLFCLVHVAGKHINIHTLYTLPHVNPHSHTHMQHTHID